MKCDRCKRSLPCHFVQPMFIHGGYAWVDPKCALEIMRKVHGHYFESFQGENAQELLEEFEAWKQLQKVKNDGS